MRLLFEGASIEGLLARVRDEHGPGARIVAADKVRRGGFAGFFTRECYAITVEVDPDNELAKEVPPAAVERPVDAPGTLLELADAIDAAEAAEARVILSTAVVPRMAQSAAAGGGSIATVVPALSTESSAFEAVLAGWAGSPDPVRAPAVPEAFDVPATPGLFVPARLERLAVASSPALPSALLTVSPPVSLPAQSDLSRRLLALGLPQELAEKVAADTSRSGLRDILARVLSEALPPLPALALRHGDVLVIAGAGADAFDLAGTVSKRLKLDPAKVLLAAPSTLGTGINPSRRLSGPTDARRRSARLHRADVATIVAVDAPCGGESAVWAGDVADALGARLMWALVDATTKPTDLADHLESLGRLDGIAVRSTGASRDPASVLRPVLDLKLPTMWLERRAGDAAAWANLIAERVGD